LKIALVVHGRFHAFDLARALLARDHSVTVLTNYPRWAAARFGLPAGCVRSFTTHGVLTRASARVSGLGDRSEAWFHTMFGRWAARELAGESWDVVHCWSGISEELLERSSRRAALTLLMRGSAHIATQSRLLQEEEARAGVPLDRPSRWMIEREQREYTLTDDIVVLSTFAKRTFEQEGVASNKVAVLPLGVDVRRFRPAPDAIERRERRIRSGETLNVLYVGALSYQKGLLDLARVIEALPSGRFRFTLVGPVTAEAAPVVRALAGRAEVVGKLPQSGLPAMYEKADIFVFPTIQDGFGMVLTQAKASGLPILTTPNSAALDLVSPGRDGWIVAIRDAEAIEARLTWCDGNRNALAAMTRQIYDRFQPRDWANVAADFDGICGRALRG
jgi:glycosyltransferase involved in cell wall biosynthesis